MTSGSRPVAARRLIPREHGAYAALAFPSATAFAAGRVTVAGLLLFAAAALLFVAHESALVALGARGVRARAEDGPRARRSLALLGGAGALAGALAIGASPLPALRLLVLPCAFALATAGLVLAGREKTLLGELVALGGLVSVGLPVAALAGVPLDRALFASIAWLALFACETLAIRATVAKPRPRAWVPSALRLAAFAAGVLTAGAAAVLLAAGSAPALCALALVPGGLLSALVAAWRVHPRRLRELGWCMVAADLAVLILLVAGMRS